MAKRKTTEELIAELKLFNHHEAAKRMQELLEQVQRARTSTGFGELAFPKSQRQDSLNAQLRDLVGVANNEGMYDAADFVSQHVKTENDDG